MSITPPYATITTFMSYILKRDGGNALRGKGMVLYTRGKYSNAQHPCKVIFHCLQANNCNVLNAISDRGGRRLDKQILSVR